MSVVLTGIDDFSIGNYVEVFFAQGAPSGVAGPLRVVFIGNRTSTGTAVVNTLYGPDTQTPAETEADVIVLTGPGSEVHRAYRKFRKVNPFTPFYFICPTESAGTAASGTITIATTATGTGNLRVFVGEDYVDVAINSGDSPTTIGGTSTTGLQAAINARTDLPVTAANAAGTVTLTAKVKGPRGNWLRIGSVITSPGSASIGTTTTPVTMTYLTSGATADSNTTALAAILGKKFYYVVSAAEDATQFGAVCAQATAEAGAASNNPQRPFAGSVDTLSNAITVAVGLNNALATIALLTQSDAPPLELAAHQAAVVALKELVFTSQSLNLNGYGSRQGDVWAVPAPRSGAAPTAAQLKQAIQNGLTPYAVDGSRTYMHKWVTTRTLSAVGGTADYRAWAGHIPSVCHRLQFAVQQTANQVLGGKVIGDNPVPGERLSNDVVYPDGFKNMVVRPVLNDFDGRGLLERADLVLQNTQCRRSTSPRTRIECRIPTTVRDILDSTTTAIDQQQPSL